MSVNLLRLVSTDPAWVRDDCTKPAASMRSKSGNIGLVNVRPADTDDAAGIAAVHIQSWQAAYRGQIPDDYLDALSVSVDHRMELWTEILSASELPRLGAFVLENGEEIVGFAHISPSRDFDADPLTGEITSMYLVPRIWGCGGGRLLMDSAISHLRAAGFQTATLWVLDSNARARHFYESAGWKAEGPAKTDDHGSFALVELRYALQL
jgi:GNAT superfamily N-acetyltransferase